MKGKASLHEIFSVLLHFLRLLFLTMLGAFFYCVQPECVVVKNNFYFYVVYLSFSSLIG